MDPKPRIAPAPDPEVSAQPGRRQFPAAEKLRILEEADQCTQPGQISALLRREGIYSALLANWRRIRDAEGVEGLRARKPGRKPLPDAHRELERLQLENLRLQERLRKAEFIIEVQKKVAELLGDGPTIQNNEPALSAGSSSLPTK